VNRVNRVNRVFGEVPRIWVFLVMNLVKFREGLKHKRKKKKK